MVERDGRKQDGGGAREKPREGIDQGAGEINRKERRRSNAGRRRPERKIDAQGEEPEPH
jgi:hypothetical protein